MPFLVAGLRLLQHLPPLATHTLCIVAVLILYMLSPARRRKAARRVAASGLRASVRLRSAYRLGRNLALMLLDNLEVVVHGEEALASLAQGGIAIGYHFGPWELLPGILARRGLRMGVVTNFYAEPAVDRFLRRFRSRDKVELFYANGPENEVRRMIEFIKSGGTVGALIDGDTFDQKYSILRRIIERFNLHVVPVFGYLKSGKMHVFVGHPLQNALRYSPEDYFWFYLSRKSFSRV